MPERRGHIRLFQRVICKLQTVKMPTLMANSDKLHPPTMSTFVCRSSWQEATHEWIRMSSLMPWASMISIFLIKDEWLHTHTSQGSGDKDLERAALCHTSRLETVNHKMTFRSVELQQFSTCGTRAGNFTDYILHFQCKIWINRLKNLYIIISIIKKRAVIISNIRTGITSQFLSCLASSDMFDIHFLPWHFKKIHKR